VLAWVFFRANKLSDAFYILKHIWNFARATAGHQSAIDPTQLLIAFVLIAGLFVAQIFEENKPIWQRLASKPAWARWAAYYAAVATFVFFLISQGGAARAQQFIYFQF
jgi:alginate O-acetyltransferase complex protein AlgI